MVLATAPAASTLEELAELADKVAEVATPVIAAVTPTPRTNEVEQKSLNFKLPFNHSPERDKAVHPAEDAGYAPQALHTNNRTICWYHKRFGDAAIKCTPPCSMAQQGNYPAIYNRVLETLPHTFLQILQ